MKKHRILLNIFIVILLLAGHKAHAVTDVCTQTVIPEKAKESCVTSLLNQADTIASKAERLPENSISQIDSKIKSYNNAINILYKIKELLNNNKESASDKQQESSKSSMLLITTALDVLPKTLIVKSNSKAQPMASYNFNNSSSTSDVVITSIYLTFSSSIEANKFSSCGLYDKEENLLMNPESLVNPLSNQYFLAAFNFEIPIVIKPTSNKTLILKCDVADSSGTANWSLTGLAYSPVNDDLDFPRSPTITIK